MSFPVFVSIGPWRLHPHVVFELLAYAVGFQIYLCLRRRHGDPIATATRWFIVAAAVVGAAIGSRVLSSLEQPGLIVQYWRNPLVVFGGKTVVGGLIGGLIVVEWTKRWIGVKTRTGDLFAIPLALGIAIGRVGCFLTGLSDGTYGSPTTLWTGVDFGDGIRRHPTQLYEIAFLLLLATILTRVRNHSARAGGQFRIFMAGYLVFRLLVDVLKPDPRLGLGLSSIQWACVAMLAYYFPHAHRWVREWRVGMARPSSA